jgi:hypothetical protein
MMSIKIEIVAFISVFVVTCFVHYFFFGLIHIFYRQGDIVQLLRTWQVIFLIVMILMTLFYPSKVMAILIVPPSFLLPPFLMPEEFLPVDFAVMLVTAIITFAFVLLVVWRQRL